MPPSFNNFCHKDITFVSPEFCIFTFAKMYGYVIIVAPIFAIAEIVKVEELSNCPMVDVQKSRSDSTIINSMPGLIVNIKEGPRPAYNRENPSLETK